MKCFEISNLGAILSFLTILNTGNLGRKVSILGVDTIGRCEKKCPYQNASNSE
jgi:uncharacterized membrane protein